jgi:hypothetical protein
MIDISAAMNSKLLMSSVRSARRAEINGDRTRKSSGKWVDLQVALALFTACEELAFRIANRVRCLDSRALCFRSDRCGRRQAVE